MLVKHERRTSPCDTAREVPDLLINYIETITVASLRSVAFPHIMERSVTRSELRSGSRSPSPPSDDEALERLRNLTTLQFATKDVSMDDAPAVAATEDEDEEMMFQLFAPSKPTTATAQTEQQPAAQKIRIRSPSLDPATIGFIHPRRPQSFYLAEPLSEKAKAEIEASAISGKQVLELSTLPQPGCAYEWKVLYVPASQVSRAARIAAAEQAPAGFSRLGKFEAPAKRRRAGKKLRIKIRSKAQAAKAKEQAALQAKDAKEEAEKEKRTRRNREKKVKRKAKEKAKKAEGGDDGAADMADSGDE